MSGKPRLKISKEVLIQKYQVEEKSARIVGLEIGSSKSNILYWLDKFKIKIRHPKIYGAGRPVIKKCLFCKKEFNARKGREVSKAMNIKFCSRRCSSRFLGKTNRLEKHQAWKGGKFIRNDGRYLFTATYCGNRKYKKEFIHRAVMEKHLRRKLEKWEEIHHKDGNKLNNKLSNLVVLTKAEHAKLHKRKNNVAAI